MVETLLSIEELSAIELNFACPNTGKAMLAYDAEAMSDFLFHITGVPGYGSKPVGVKLPPFLEVAHCRAIVAVISKFPINFVVVNHVSTLPFAHHSLG